MNVRIVYDGACPFCDDYARYQDLRARVDSVELIDARTRPEVLAAEGLAPADLEDGMVVIVDGVAHHGADAVYWLSRHSAPSRRSWIRAVAALSRSPGGARRLYPWLKAGRRLALTILRVPRFPR